MIDVWLTDREKRGSGVCCVRGCDHPVRKNIRGGFFCYRCAQRRNRERNPLVYAYKTLRSNARRRKHPFTLTLEQFEVFCIETGYLARKGRNPDSLTIDRIDARRGYEVGNLQVLTLIENVRKQNEEASSRRRHLTMLAASNNSSRYQQHHAQEKEYHQHVSTDHPESDGPF